MIPEMTDNEKVWTYENLNWHASAPPVCTAWWDKYAWMRHIGDTELKRVWENYKNA